MYIGLLNNSKEPVGYTRQEGDWNSTVFFDNPNGFGVVTHLALFEDEAGGNPVEIIELPEAVDCKVGTIPVVRGGRLICGQPVSASCVDEVNLDLMVM